MKRNHVTIFAAVALLAPAAGAFARADFQVNLGLGLPVYVAPPPVYYEPPQQYYTPAPPVYYGPSVIYEDRYRDDDRREYRDRDDERGHHGHRHRR